MSIKHAEAPRHVPRFTEQMSTRKQTEESPSYQHALLDLQRKRRKKYVEAPCHIKALPDIRKKCREETTYIEATRENSALPRIDTTYVEKST